MSLHRLAAITIGVPDVDACAGFYRDFGLTEVASARFATVDGGEQLRLEHAPRRGLVELGLGVDDGDDLDRLDASVQACGFTTERAGDGFVVEDPPTGVRVRVDVAPRLPEPVNGAPGPRRNERAPAVDREDPVRPRKLGHVVLGSPDATRTRRLFLDGLGFKVSDEIAGLAAFMRC